MKLHELSPAPGASKDVFRKGRGHGSGNGKTAGKGHKGQKARSGAKQPGFEGGQMPLQRRVPKRGFTNIFATKYTTVNVGVLDGVKVLGNGELTKKLTVNCAAFSASAKEKIEKAGGKAEVK